MSGQQPEQGWYPDPAAPDRLRWWDGDDWSDHVVSAAAAAACSVAAAAPEPAPEPALTPEPEPALTAEPEPAPTIEPEPALTAEPVDLLPAAPEASAGPGARTRWPLLAAAAAAVVVVAAAGAWLLLPHGQDDPAAAAPVAAASFVATTAGADGAPPVCAAEAASWKPHGAGRIAVTLHLPGPHTVSVVVVPAERPDRPNPHHTTAAVPAGGSAVVEVSAPPAGVASVRLSIRGDEGVQICTAPEAA